jgi:hypothetical protein
MRHGRGSASREVVERLVDSVVLEPLMAEESITNYPPERALNGVMRVTSTRRRRPAWTPIATPTNGPRPSPQAVTDVITTQT